ncbi:hypothetical protein QQG74_03335 [Micromonospora sp. FIMYZ51]|uniref:hypothetical protein n=1 Tax=Micromonospora sp. FIMYZ51 TaxID=3051832 RepID=UPI00311DED66
MSPTSTTVSPLFTRAAPTDDYRTLATVLAQQCTDISALRSLLTVTEPETAEQVVHALDVRTDLPIRILTALVAARPDLRASTGRLRALLFPTTTGCHRFARTIAALEHRPDMIDAEFVATSSFARHAGEADPEALMQALAGTFKCRPLTPDRLPTMQALLSARQQTAPDPFTDRAAALVARTVHTTLVQPLATARDGFIAWCAAGNGGLTRVAETLLDGLESSAGTPWGVAAAMAIVTTFQRQSPVPDGHAPALVEEWEAAWQANVTTPDGAVWEPHQRVLVTAYQLLTEHARTHAGTPITCWAIDTAGRTLLHAVADRLTGYQGLRPLDHFTDDAVLLAFARGLSKLRRDRIPDDLHLAGFMAAVKAARSKNSFIDTEQPIHIGIVVPTRGESARLESPTPSNPHGQDAARVKLAQLAWLTDTTPDAKVGLLFVDEDPTGESAQRLRQLLASNPPTPRISITIARYPYGTSTTTSEGNVEPAIQPASSPDNTAKGGAVLWGLTQLAGVGYPAIFYTDLDLTYPLDQAGLLLRSLATDPNVGAAIGSRRTPDAYGYYPASGPNRTSQLYQQAVAELLDLDHVTDPQAGFKAFPADLLREILPATRDRHLSFDTELLLLTRLAGRRIAETGVGALHRYVDGMVGTPRDYDTMLARVRQQAHDHHLDPERRPTPTLNHITSSGGITPASQISADTATRLTIRPAAPRQRPRT